MEKTTLNQYFAGCVWKHLHGRGEDSFQMNSTLIGMETPPRTWRRLPSVGTRAEYRGNTSTDVEKTPQYVNTRERFEKHLHGRGEDFDVNVQVFYEIETPPRAWRRHRLDLDLIKRLRNTSTDVEKTRTTFWDQRSERKHLHGRGEDFAP